MTNKQYIAAMCKNKKVSKVFKPDHASSTKAFLWINPSLKEILDQLLSVCLCTHQACIFGDFRPIL